MINAMDKKEAQNISDEIVTRLKQERERKGISLNKLANDTGISKSSLSCIENLTQKPTLYMMIWIADYLGVDLSDLVKRG